MSNLPSHDFLTRQAILNAVPNCWPAASHAYGVRGALIVMGCARHRNLADPLAPFIITEFRKLVASFDQSVAA